MISRRGKGTHDFPPRVGEFRKTMEKQDEGPPVGLESCLEHMDREAVDVLDNAGADAGWQRGLAVGWKVACLHANDGRILRDRRTANRRGQGCQTSLPRIRWSAPDLNCWNAETRSDIFRPLDRPH